MKWTIAAKAPLVFAALFLSACDPITEHEWTRENAEAATTRVYRGVTPANAITAAENVLKLADGDDVRFSYGQNSFIAQRNHFLYIVIAAAGGTFTYQVTAAPVAGGTQVSLMLANQSTAILPGSVVPAIPNVVPSGADQIRMVEPYNLYFARMDYLLGQSSDWITCGDAPARLGGTEETYAVLCRSADDRTPD